MINAKGFKPQRKYRGFGAGDVINGGVHHGSEVWHIRWSSKEISIAKGDGEALKSLTFREFDEQVVGIF